MARKTKTTYVGQGKAIRRKLIDMNARFPNACVTIGVHSGAGDYEGTNVSVSRVALWNEFGTPNARYPTPERSFLRSTLKDNRDKIAAWREEAIRNILEKDWTAEKALSMVGLRIQFLVQNRIRSNIPPPNAPGTLNGMFGKPGKIELGQGTNTLIATGKLLRSISFQVHLDGFDEAGST